jgi:hypothetical protein
MYQQSHRSNANLEYSFKNANLEYKKIRNSVCGVAQLRETNNITDHYIQNIHSKTREIKIS